MKIKPTKWIITVVALFLCIGTFTYAHFRVRALSANEDEVYTILTNTYGFSSAQASGIMASIQAESNFIPTALDAGGISFGLMQWTGNRKAALYSYAEANNMDVNAISTQLAYMYSELQSSEKTAYNQLIACENTSEGAYNAGYRFCYYFERPKNKESRSIKRATLARDSYFANYNNGTTATSGTINAPEAVSEVATPSTNTTITTTKKYRYKKGTYKLKLTMSVRTKASNKGKVVGYISKGKKVYVKAVKNVKWGKITYRGKSSYISLNYAKKL